MSAHDERQAAEDVVARLEVFITTIVMDMRYDDVSYALDRDAARKLLVESLGRLNDGEDGAPANKG